MSSKPNRHVVMAGDDDVAGTDQPREAVMFEAVQRYRGHDTGRDRTFPALREREFQIFGLSALTIVAYRLDDAFLQMNPGTSPGDHLSNGLLPAAILLAASLAWPIMATSVRALVSLLIGLLALTTGIATSGYHAYSDGPSGSDWSGLLAIAASIILLGLGVWLTHCAIAKPVRRDWRWAGKRTLVVVGAVAAILFVVAPIVFATVVTDFPRQDLCCETPADYGLTYENVTFQSTDGLELAAWYIPSRNGATIVAVSGVNTRVGAIKHAAMLAERGYGVLLYDKRGTGESEGDPHLFGWDAQPDITGALDYLESRPDVDPDRIGAIGLSLGGEILLEAAAHDERIHAVVADGPGARSIKEEMLSTDSQINLGVPFIWANNQVIAILSGDDAPERLDHLVARIAPRPLMLIAAGTGVEPDLMQIYYDAASEPKTLWEIPESHHIKGLISVPDEYEQRVIEFFDAELLGKQAKLYP
jgi:fermentation-respiration switch protein FrsA (DUF1100 family)